ncbi:Rieske (2Fe-2S) protein [Nocardia vaccinii]|uniref:Rieske (2Fe-2S) protein n=1 Tax=Nocardia vaccinii TaxID=1822 RepID=UPI0012F48ACD|nr:Rieske (2Fe-2S) protein [Nocardia vaccinii]
MTISATRVRVCASADIEEKGRLVLDIGPELTIGLFRVKGKLYAYPNNCPHMGGPVCQGLIIDGVREVLGEHQQTLHQEFDPEDPHIVCPWHGFEFSITTGRHAGAGHPVMHSIPVSEENGDVYVQL